MDESDRPLGGKRCLVLDDEFLIALDIQQILESAGAAEVTSVSNAADALAALQAQPKFDVAILDVKLGDTVSGSHAVATALAARGTPFVFLTGMHGDIAHTLLFPDAPVVEKPYQAPQLLDSLLRALTRR